MDLIIFVLLLVLALGCFVVSKREKVVYLMLVSAGAFFILAVLLLAQGISVETGSKVICLDVNGNHYAGGSDCGSYGYDINALYTTYTQSNNQVILLLGWLSFVAGIISILDGLWLVATVKGKGGM